MLKILLLLVSVQTLHAIICYSNGSFYFSRNTFNWNNLSSILLEIENHTASTGSLCHVRITVDYYSNKHNYVTIQFGLPNHHHNTYIEFGSTINFHRNDIQSLTSYLDYSCSSGNFCDRTFLNKWAKQFLNAHDNALHTSFLSLWKDSGTAPHKCNSKRVTNECSSYLCFIIYDELKNLSYGRSQCRDKSSTNPVHIYIKTRGENSIDYQCAKNHCTDELIYNSTAEKYYKDKSAFDDMQLYSKELNEIIFKRTIAIVAILLFIGGVAYYIRCRNYRKGYRLATIA